MKINKAAAGKIDKPLEECGSTERKWWSGRPGCARKRQDFAGEKRILDYSMSYHRILIFTGTSWSSWLSLALCTAALFEWLANHATAALLMFKFLVLPLLYGIIEVCDRNDLVSWHDWMTDTVMAKSLETVLRMSFFV